MNGRRIILAFIVVAFVVIFSILIFSIDWGGGSRPPVVRQVNISDLANTDTKVRMTARNIINNNQEHQQLEVIVGRDSTVGTLINGYQGNVVRTEQTTSNQEAYQAFLSALHNADFTSQQIPPKGVQYDGACPKGTRYTFEFIGGKDTPKSTWATSCGKKIGNFAGDLSLTRALFRAQLPEAQFRALTNDTQF